MKRQREDRLNRINRKKEEIKKKIADRKQVTESQITSPQPFGSEEEVKQKEREDAELNNAFDDVHSSGQSINPTNEASSKSNTAISEEDREKALEDALKETLGEDGQPIKTNTEEKGIRDNPKASPTFSA